MNLDLVFDLARQESEVFRDVPKESIEHVPFYGDMYNYTYGQSKAILTPITDIMVKEKMTKDKRILEVFAGAAFESGLIQMYYPKNDYYSLDIEDSAGYGQSFKNISYIIGDAVNGVIPGGPYNMIFGGVTNSSQSEIPTLKDMTNHFITVGKAIKKNGIFIVSIFYKSFGAVNGKFSTQYEAVPIEYGKNSSQNWVSHTYSIYQTNFQTGLVSFYMLNVIKQKGKIIKALYSDDYKARDWTFDVVGELGSDNGFEFLTQYSNFTYGILVFRKR